MNPNKIQLTEQTKEQLLQLATEDYPITTAADYIGVSHRVLYNWINKPSHNYPLELSLSLAWKKTKAKLVGDRIRVLWAIANKKNRDSLMAIKQLTDMNIMNDDNYVDGVAKLVDALKRDTTREDVFKHTEAE